MRIITINVNGLRAATRKGLFPWLAKQDADVICFQEIRCSEDQITSAMRLEGYTPYYAFAQRKGYSGVALYCKQTPQRVITEIGLDWADQEGRYLQADFDGLSVVSCYFPSGSHDPIRQDLKYAFMDHVYVLMQGQKRERRQWVWCGDVNIAHTEKDIKNWRGNQKNSGFLPEERAWLTQLFNEVGWIDAFRCVNDLPDQYTWWSNRGRAWDNNVGWRIDYQMITPGMQALSAHIYKDERFSDHAPLIMEYS